MMKEKSDKVPVLIALNLDGYLFCDDWKSDYRNQIRERLAADFTNSDKDWQKFNAEVEKVIRALRTDTGGR